MTDQEQAMMERYLLTFEGHWRVIAEGERVDDNGESFYECDLCHSSGSMPRLMDRIGNYSGERDGEFSHFEPYLCAPHARELGILW